MSRTLLDKIDLWLSENKGQFDVRDAYILLAQARDVLTPKKSDWRDHQPCNDHSCKICFNYD